MGIDLNQISKVFARHFYLETDNCLFSPNLIQDLTAGTLLFSSYLKVWKFLFVGIIWIAGPYKMPTKLQLFFGDCHLSAKQWIVVSTAFQHFDLEFFTVTSMEKIRLSRSSLCDCFQVSTD